MKQFAIATLTFLCCTLATMQYFMATNQKDLLAVIDNRASVLMMQMHQTLHAQQHTNALLIKKGLFSTEELEVIDYAGYDKDGLKPNNTQEVHSEVQ